MWTFGAFLVSFLAASGHVAALPTTSLRAGTSAGKHNVPVVRSTNYTPNGPLELAKAYRKFGTSIPSDLAAAVAAPKKRDIGSVANKPVGDDTAYICPVQIGTPAQTLTLNFDTGSSDLWVFSTATPADKVHGQTLYDPSKSSTARFVNGSTWSIGYADGSSASGEVYTDVVSIGGLRVPGQTVELATNISSGFSQGTSTSGLVGLAFSSLNMVKPNRATTFWDTASSEMDQNLFTADLKHNATGSYNFGFIDHSLYRGRIYYTQVDTKVGWWGFTTSGYAVDYVNGDGHLTGASFSGIADTGTTLLILPNAVAQDYYSAVDGAQYNSSEGGYIFPCSSSLPNFTFGIGNGAITVPGEYINFAPIGDNFCFGSIQRNGNGYTIFGDIALKSAFVVFDGGNMQLGWASKSLS